MPQADNGLTTIPSTRRTPSPLDTVVHNAGRALQTLSMTRLSAYADEEDAKSLNSDLDVLCKIVDPMIEAIGLYAAEHFNGIDVRLFRDQLRGALEGNATFEIEQAGERVTQDRYEDEAA